MLDIPSISGMVAAIGVIIGVAFTILELRNLAETRQTDLVLRLHSIATSKKFMEAYTNLQATEFKDYDDFTKKYGSLVSNNPIPIAADTVSTFYETLGVLLYRKLIDIRLVYDLFSVKRPWEKVKPIAEGARKSLDQPDIYIWFEYLYNETQKRENRLKQKYPT